MAKAVLFDIDFASLPLSGKMEELIDSKSKKSNNYAFFTRWEPFEILSPYFLNREWKCVFTEDFFTCSELEEIDDLSAYLIKNWSDSHIPKSCPQGLSFKGVNLLSIWDYELTNTIPFLLKKLKLIKKIIEEVASENIEIVADSKRIETWRAITNHIKKPYTINIKLKKYPNEAHSNYIKPKYTSNFLFNIFQVLLSTAFNIVILISSRILITPKKRVILFEDSNSLLSLIKNEEKMQNNYHLFFQQHFSFKLLKKYFQKDFINYGYLFLNNFPFQTKDKTLSEINSHLLITWNTLKNNEGFKNFFKYEDIYFWPLIENYFENLFLSKIKERIKLIRNIYFWLNHFNPNLIILKLDNVPFERTICEVAKVKKIKTLVIQHGIQAERRAHDTIFADLYAMWGNAHKQRYIRWGNSPVNIAVTGNPGFDRFNNCNENQDIKRKLFTELDLAHEKKLITLATRSNWPMYWFSAFRYADSETIHLKELIRALDHYDDFQLVLKVHPGEIRDGMYHRLLQSFSYKTPVTITKDINLDDLLLASDLVISTGSTVALEAMILNKPVIIINFTLRQDLIPYAKDGGALGIYRKEDLVPAIGRIFDDKELRKHLEMKRKTFIKDYAFRIDGNSSQRVWQEINNIIEPI